MIDPKPRGILGDDRVARAPAQHRVVAVAQPAVQDERFELVERAGHVAISLTMRVERNRHADPLESPLEIVDPPPVELDQAQVAAGGEIGQALRSILMVDAGAGCG